MIGEYVSVFLIIFAASFLFLGKWNGKKKHSHRYPPSLPSLPLVGSLPFLRDFSNIAKFFMEKSHNLGPVFTFRVGSKLVLTLNNKEVIEEALVKNSRSFSFRPEFFLQKLTNPNRKGIAFGDTTPEWKIIHKHSLSVLREFGFGDKSVMEERILREVEAMIDFGRKTGGKPFDPKELYLLVASNVTMSILFGSRRIYDLGISDLILEMDRLVHLMDMNFDIAPFLRFIPPFKDKIPAIKSCSEKVYDLTDTEIDKNLRAQNMSFVSEYIKREGPNYDRVQLNFLLRDLIGGGTDTTSITMRWSMVVLANRPEIQKKLQEDIDSVISIDRLPTLHDQKNLPYVEATILELYRWRTLLPLSVARYTKHDSILKNFFIPAGTLVLPNLYAAHSDPTVWKEPDIFRPERFLDKENNVIGQDRILSFSLGRRSCLGEILARAEIFLLLTSLLQRFTVLPPRGQDKVCDEMMLPVDIVSAPKAFSVRLTERQ